MIKLTVNGVGGKGWTRRLFDMHDFLLGSQICDKRIYVKSSLEILVARIMQDRLLNNVNDLQYEWRLRDDLPKKKNVYFRALPESGEGGPLPESFGRLFTKY